MNRFKVKRKVVLLGDSAVGKTSLIRRYVLDKFDDKYITTIGTKVTKKEMSIERDNAIIDLTLMIWDVLGQQGYTSIQAKSYRGADGVMLVYDLTRQESLDNIESYWLAELNKVAENVPAVLVGNKVDLQDEREVSKDYSNDFAERLGTPHFLSSAKTGENVERLFLRLGEVVVKSVGTEAMSQAEEKDILSLTDAADRIMVDFIESFGDQEMGMAIIRQQFKKAGVDISSPTKESLHKAVTLMATAERDFKSDKEVSVNLAKRKAMIDRIK
jgi:small GTP-binding protein